MEGSWNLNEVLRQLGLKNVSQLPVVRAIQPVLPLGDSGGITPPLLPPAAWVGGASAAAVGRYSGFQFQAAGAGGTYLRYFSARAGTSGRVTWGITATNPAAGLATACPTYEMGPTPLQTRCFDGNSASSLSINDYPTAYIANNADRIFPDLIYVPLGRWLTILDYSVNVSLEYMALVQDVPAAPLSPTG